METDIKMIFADIVPTASSTTLRRTTGLDKLPAEIRYMVYRFLFPDLHRLTDFRIERDFGIPPSGIGERQPWKGKVRNTGRNGKRPDTRAQLGSAAALMSTCRTLRQEIAPIVYTNVCLAWNNNAQLQNHTAELSKFVKSLIPELWIEIPNKWNGLVSQQSMCDILKDFTGLQALHISACNRTADEATTGTKWKSYDLQAMRAIRKARPELVCSCYCDVPYRPELSSVVHLAVEPIKHGGSTNLDIDDEYEEWLDVVRKRRGEKGDGFQN